MKNEFQNVGTEIDLAQTLQRVNPIESLWLFHEFPTEFPEGFKRLLRPVTDDSAITTYRRDYQAAIVIIERRGLIRWYRLTKQY